MSQVPQQPRAGGIRAAAAAVAAAPQQPNLQAPPAAPPPAQGGPPVAAAVQGGQQQAAAVAAPPGQQAGPQAAGAVPPAPQGPQAAIAAPQGPQAAIAAPQGPQAAAAAIPAPGAVPGGQIPQAVAAHIPAPQAQGAAGNAPQEELWQLVRTIQTTVDGISRGRRSVDSILQDLRRIAARPDDLFEASTTLQLVDDLIEAATREKHKKLEEFQASAEELREHRNSSRLKRAVKEVFSSEVVRKVNKRLAPIFGDDSNSDTQPSTSVIQAAPVQAWPVPVQNAQFPGQNFQFPVHTQFPAQNFSMQNPQFPFQNTQFPLAMHNTQFPMQNTLFPMQNTQYPMQNTQLPMQNTQFPMQSTMFPMQYPQVMQQPQGLVLPQPQVMSVHKSSGRSGNNRRCYECGSYNHLVAMCPRLKRYGQYQRGSKEKQVGK